jgi:hypothetical protein
MFKLSNENNSDQSLSEKLNHAKNNQSPATLSRHIHGYWLSIRGAYHTTTNTHTRNQ